MNITKTALESCIADMPDVIDADEVMYRVYLLQKVQAGEEDIRNGKVISHDDALQRLSEKWRA